MTGADNPRDDAGGADEIPREEPIEPTGGPIDAANPFPTHLLPSPMQEFVEEGARAIGCEESFVAVPLLSILASVVGNSRRIKLKRTWYEPCVIWAVIVGPSGCLKSPAVQLGLRPLIVLQRAAMKAHEEVMKEFRRQLLRYRRDLKKWERSKKEGEPPEEPSAPVAERFLCEDITLEALAMRLLGRPRGFLLHRDELGGWFGSFNQYRQGKGGDEARWLEVHRAGLLLVDRKTGPTPTICVPRAAVSIVGSIQPETLRAVLGREHFANGMAARLLFTLAGRRAKTWTDAELPEWIEQALEKLIDSLLALATKEDANGHAEPFDLPLSPRARELWIAFYNAHAREEMDLDGDLAAAWSKLEGYAARLALLVHLIRCAASDPTIESEMVVDEHSVAAGIALSQWFGREAERVYAAIAETKDGREQRELIDLIRARGGEISVRDLMRASRRYRGSAEGATAALQALVDEGIGVWVPVPTTAAGGQPTRVFKLNEEGPRGDRTPGPGSPNWDVSPSPAPNGPESEVGPEGLGEGQDRVGDGRDADPSASRSGPPLRGGRPRLECAQAHGGDGDRTQVAHARDGVLSPDEPELVEVGRA